MPEVNIWWAQTIQPKTPMAMIATDSPGYEKGVDLLIKKEITCEIIAKAGKINTYTSGCPKNQNKCWYNNKSPPKKLEKKEVLKLRSNNNIVMAAAKTGNDIINKKLTVSCAIINKGYWKKEKKEIKGKKKTVETKLIEDKIEEAPAKCKENIRKSVEYEGAAG